MYGVRSLSTLKINQPAIHHGRRLLSKHFISIYLLLVLIAVIVISLDLIHSPKQLPAASGTTTSRHQPGISSQPTSKISNGSTPQTSSASSATKATTNQVQSTSGRSTLSGTVNANSTVQTVPACNLVLTVSQAQLVLGTSIISSGGNGILSQTPDITKISCSYSSGDSVATIVEYQANTITGQHENDDQFGSEKPAGVTTDSGYGQSAYWQSSTGLNVLDNNNWLIVSFTVNGTLEQNTSQTLAQAAQL